MKRWQVVVLFPVFLAGFVTELCCLFVRRGYSRERGIVLLKFGVSGIFGILILVQIASWLLPPVISMVVPVEKPERLVGFFHYPPNKYEIVNISDTNITCRPSVGGELQEALAIKIKKGDTFEFRGNNNSWGCNREDSSWKPEHDPRFN